MVEGDAIDVAFAYSGFCFGLATVHWSVCDFVVIMDEPPLKRLKCAAKDKDDADDAEKDKAGTRHSTTQPGTCISNGELLGNARLALAKQRHAAIEQLVTTKLDEYNVCAVVSNMCRCGRSRPSFGHPGERPVCCASCRDEGMVDVVNKK